MLLLHTIGSLMIIGGSSFLGYYLSLNCAKRPQQIREIQVLLQIFENEISFLSNLLTDAFDKVYKSSKSEVGEFFKHTIQNLKSEDNLSASQAWEGAIKENIKKTALNKEDADVLIDFGKMLGKSDLEGQIKNIKLTISQLKLQEKKAEESRSKNEAIFKKLGVLGGIALVIILI